MAYPTALRARAVDSIQSGGTYADAEIILQLCRKTLNKWVARHLHTGNLRSIPAPYNPRRWDYEALRGYVANHSDRMLHELGIQFEVNSRAPSSACFNMATNLLDKESVSFHGIPSFPLPLCQ